VLTADGAGKPALASLATNASKKWLRKLGFLVATAEPAHTSWRCFKKAANLVPAPFGLERAIGPAGSAKPESNSERQANERQFKMLPCPFLFIRFTRPNVRFVAQAQHPLVLLALANDLRVEDNEHGEI
jgi:hypothetical protein